jgi:hypothetical protein
LPELGGGGGGGGRFPTLTWTFCVRLPALLVAVKVYVVVVVGVTDLEVEPVTLMAPGSSLKLVAPATTHERVEDCPFVIEPGDAVNEEIVGEPGGGVGVGVGEPLFAVVNVRSPDVDRLPASSLDFTL